MSPPRGLKAFLATARQALSVPLSQRPKPLTLVVGNESADLDSICSALLYAYFRTHTPPHNLHVPLSNLPRADLALRPELDAVLGPAGLKPDDLITLTDLPREPPLNPPDTRWLLVDHNVLTGELATPFSHHVIGCVDHHDDEGVVPHELPAGEPRMFAKCGSCMSLVLDQCKPVWDSLSSSSSSSSSQPDGDEDAALAHIALAPILIDTTNLTSPDKTTDWDVRAAALAESKLSLSLNRRRGGTATTSPSPSFSSPSSSTPTLDTFDRAGYFTTLTTLKEQIAHLSHRDVLRKDYKRWTEGPLALGVSTVVHGFNYVLRELGNDGRPRPDDDDGRDAFLAALRAWADEQRLDVAAVMTVSRPPGEGFARELLVWGLNEQAVRVVREFERRFGEALGLERWGSGELDSHDDDVDGKGKGEGVREWRRCWRQRRIEHSRKQVAPMLREAMKESSRL
ncbi:hypothetical protein VTK26DRAFT_4382 [Humicola hyalothermophila]